MGILLWILEAAPSPSFGSLPRYIESVGVVGLLAWILWYEKSVAEPRREKEAIAERQQIREDYLEQIRLFYEAHERADPSNQSGGD